MRAAFPLIPGLFQALSRKKSPMLSVVLVLLKIVNQLTLESTSTKILLAETLCQTPQWPCRISHGLSGSGRRGASVPRYGVRGRRSGGVENTGYGKPVMWKTRGLVENTGSSKWETPGTIFFFVKKCEFSSLQSSESRPETRFSIIKHFVRTKTIQELKCRALVSFRVSISFFYSRNFVWEKKAF